MHDQPSTDSTASPRTSRAYVHLGCGEATEASGPLLTVLSNPFECAGNTRCDTCGKVFPIDQMAWADTGEVITVYRQRLFNDSPAMIRHWVRWVGPLIYGAVGAGVGWLIGGWFGPDNQLPGAVGGAIGSALLGTTLVNPFLCPAITRADYRQFD